MKPVVCSAPRVTRPRFFVISGGPGAGKTTLLDELRRRGYAVVEEVAREVIRLQASIGGQALPWANASLYSELEFAQNLHNFVSQDPSQITFFDRSFIDPAGFLRLLGREIPSHFAGAHAAFRFAPTVMLAPPWPEIYRVDQQRRQSLAEAEQTYGALSDVYQQAGYDVFEMPRAPVRERADAALSLVERLREQSGERGS